ncbi:MAG: metallophosphoesterase family protein [Sulfurimonas sp.]|uniref:purple acid phosphatase family protein n=1 Tax=Sulfurimonas sp. TaxID=2022749 RepID=UPI0025EA8ECC|nr:metallophosphoesterase family protein [Sulfurimonas sp.]MCK9490535.1 metallophosphoesterase family protein [Sulfurimonas sp.]
MKKFFKTVLKLVFIAALLYGIGRFGINTYDSHVFVPRSPYTVMQTQDSITIRWNSPKFEIGSVEYGFFSDSLDKTLVDPKKTKIHSITISGLNECTKYYYKVLSDSMSIDNEDRSFKTLCAAKDTQKLWVIGDSGQVGENQTKVYTSMLDYIEHDFNNLNMWVLLGNNAYKNGSQKQYNESFFEPYSELLKRFTPWAVIGNNDAKRWAFYNIFDFPTKGESGGEPSGNEKFYSIESGNLHLVMLDSEMYRIDRNSDLAAWLREDLKKNTKPWVIVALHTPPYTDGSHNSDSDYDSGGRLKKVRENLVPIFDEFGVDLVLSGHSHSYERSKLMINHIGKSNTLGKHNIVQDAKSCYTKSIKPSKDSGTIYQVCGSSSKLEHATLKHPALPFAYEQMGSLIIDITPTTLSSKFLSIDAKILDEFIIKKNTTPCQ